MLANVGKIQGVHKSQVFQPEETLEKARQNTGGLRFSMCILFHVFLFFKPKVSQHKWLFEVLAASMLIADIVIRAIYGKRDKWVW